MEYKHCNFRKNRFSNKHALLKKNHQTKISHIFRTDRDISKIRKVLNSAYRYHEEQVVEVLRKSAKFSFAGVKSAFMDLVAHYVYRNKCGSEKLVKVY